MQKCQGPGFKRARIELEPCPTCKGKAVVQGLFYELICADCNGSGWRVLDNKLVLSSDELITQLNFKLRDAQREILALRSTSQADEPLIEYEKSNRLGAGGTNYTGD